MSVFSFVFTVQLVIGPAIQVAIKPACNTVTSEASLALQRKEGKAPHLGIDSKFKSFFFFYIYLEVRVIDWLSTPTIHNKIKTYLVVKITAAVGSLNYVERGFSSS